MEIDIDINDMLLLRLRFTCPWTKMHKKKLTIYCLFKLYATDRETEEKQVQVNVISISALINMHTFIQNEDWGNH